VFVVVLENENYDATFGASSQAPFLARELPSHGVLLPNYYGIGHLSLDDYVAMVSGQGPNPVTQADCQVYTDVVPGTLGVDGQAAGLGCVYPAPVLTVADQLKAAGWTWRGYMEDMANSTTQPHECRHPASGSQDSTQTAKAGDQYAARHNPFVYFHSIIDDANGCAANDVSLDRLASDLRSAQTTPNYVFIVPNLCHDGHDSPCVDGQPGGLRSANDFLNQWIPQIVSSPAFQADGVLMVTFDESGSGAEACCAERAANTPNAGGNTPGPGGGRVGAVLLSRYIAPGTRSQTPYNHYSLLRSIEDIFGVSHLGYAAQDGLVPFGADVFNARTPAPVPVPVPVPTPVGCRAAALPRARHGRLPRGALLGSVRVRHRRGHRRVLDVTTRRFERLRITVSYRGRTRRLRSRLLRGCQRYRFALPRYGRVTVVASIHRQRERRTPKG
jgi:hypothetical protein